MATPQQTEPLYPDSDVNPIADSIKAFLMKPNVLIALGLCALVPLFSGCTPESPVAKTYTDSRGKKVNFPLGDRSFADKVVSCQIGIPAPIAKYKNPQKALGVPDYIDEAHESTGPTSVSLGCGGSITLQFEDNVLIDVPGPDLYVFEVGPAVEATELSLSKDGTTWVKIGQISGGTAEIDIAKYIQPGEEFSFVRLVDLKSSCGGEFSGADIDAVGAIGSHLVRRTINLWLWLLLLLLLLLLLVLFLIFRRRKKQPKPVLQ